MGEWTRTRTDLNPGTATTPVNGHLGTRPACLPGGTLMAASTAKTTIPPFASQQLEGISKPLAATAAGLKGSEIGHLPRDCGMPDPSPAITKWQRLHNAFAD